MIVRRLLNCLSFALTATALGLTLAGCGGGLPAVLFAAPAGLLALIVIAMLVASPPKALKQRLLEATIAFACSTGVLLLAA